MKPPAMLAHGTASSVHAAHRTSVERRLFGAACVCSYRAAACTCCVHERTRQRSASPQRLALRRQVPPVRAAILSPTLDVSPARGGRHASSGNPLARHVLPCAPGIPVGAPAEELPAFLGAALRSGTAPCSLNCLSEAHSA
eukprot:7386474-Prymnesium_polylepis.4